MLSVRRLLVHHLKSMHCQAKCDTTETTKLSSNQSKSTTPLKNLFPWKSKDEFCDFLKESVFFNHDGIIALNKPYGVAQNKFKPNAEKPVNILSRSQIPNNKYTLEDALPELREFFQAKHLQILKSTERYTSGVCLLVTNEATATRVKKCFNKNANARVPHQCYWAITRGAPIPTSASGKLGYKLIKLEDRVEPEVMWTTSRTQFKLGNVKSVLASHETLLSNQDLKVSLCQVETSTNKWHFVRTYLIQRTACVLGDTLYSPRIRTVMGRNIVLSPQNYNKDVDPLPALEKQVKVNLSIDCKPGQEMAHLPVMLHLKSLHLTKWKKDKDLVLTAPLSEHFSWTCKQLNLDVAGIQSSLAVTMNS